MSAGRFDLQKISPAMKVAFQEAVSGAEEAGYPYLVLLPRDILQLVGRGTLKLTMPIAEKTEININEITKFFLTGEVGVSVHTSEDRHLEGQSASMRFIGFKTEEQRDALIAAVKGMEFFNQEKVYALAYGGDEAKAMGDVAIIAQSAYSRNL